MITAHQLQYSVQLLYHHLAAPLGDLQTYIGLDHHLNDNHPPQIALLASSASIELVSSSASAKFHKTAIRSDIETPGPIDRTPETPGSGKNDNRSHLLMQRVDFGLHMATCLGECVDGDSSRLGSNIFQSLRYFWVIQNIVVTPVNPPPPWTLMVKMVNGELSPSFMVLFF